MRRRSAAAATVIGLGLTSGCGLGDSKLESAVAECTAQLDDAESDSSSSGPPPAGEILSLDDDGQSLVVRTPEPAGQVNSIWALGAAGCVLEETDAPSAVFEKMNSTTALMGRQSDDWDDLEVEWSYSGSSSTFVAYFETAD